MLPIQQLLLRFKNLTNTDKVKKEALIEIFKDNQIPLTVSQISFSKNTIFLKIPPIIRSEVILKKPRLLTQIKTIPGLEGVNTLQ